MATLSLKRLVGGTAILVLFLASAFALAGDWPMWAGSPSRNMVSQEKNLPTSADVSQPGENGAIDVSKTKNVKWIAKLGSAAYGNAVVAKGRVFLGTNNGTPRLAKYSGDFGILLCLDEASGKFLWQLAVPKLTAGKNSDWEQVGLCCSPTVDGDRVYIVTNRCEVLCLAAQGFTGKNQGPFTDEAQYTAGPGKPPIAQGPGDADIIWRYDMRDELGVFPHNMTSSSVLVVGDHLFVTTSNGMDWSNKHMPAPDAPALICLDKNSGKLLAVERSGISGRTLTSNWSSPAYGTVGGKQMLVFGAGDGYCYGFDPDFVAHPGPAAQRSSPGAPPDVPTIKELWRCDCNPPSHKIKDGKAIKYGDADGPSEIIATPVIDHDRVYVAVGQEPEQGEGVGALTCIDATKTGDITQPGKVWVNDKIGRSISTASISEGLLFICDFAGIIHSLDPQTGKEFWNHDTEAHIWGSTLVADGKVYAGNENGLVNVFALSKEKKLLGTIDFKDAVYSTPVAANGVLFIATQNNLFALQQK